jgi:hypothetical protein
VIFTHDSDAVAVQEQVGPAVTANDPLPPPEEKVWLEGSMLYEHGAGASCDTVKVRPPAVIVALLAAPLFASTPNWMVPLPEPLAPDVMRTHDWEAVAVHVHPAAAVIVKEPVPPDGLKPWLDGLMLYAQPEPWLTVNVWPAIVSAPDREGPVFAATLNCTVPSPLPVAPAVTVIHAALLDAVHAHPAAVRTVTVPVLVPLPTDCEERSIVKLHPAVWVTVNRCPSTRSVPVRDGPSHALTLKATVPGPVPDCPEISAIHGTSLCADHVQPSAVLTAIVPEPPLAPTDCAVGRIEVLHPTPCRTVTVFPATVNTPVRDGPVVDRASNTTCPVPVPCAPSTIDSHGVSLRAVHAHCAPLAVTVTVLRSPAGETDTLNGDTVKVQGAAS